MTSETREEWHRKRRRKQLLRGLVLGGAAVGLPALVNLVVARRARQLPAARWGSGDRYLWQHGEIVYQHLGAGAPLLLLHSLGPGHSALEWRPAAEILAAERRVYVPDLLGWGRSARPARVYRGSLYVKLLGDFLAQVIGEPAVVVAAGHSAAYAVEVATLRPELVQALALVVPVGLEQQQRAGSGLRDRLIYPLLRLPILGTSALNLYTSRAALASYLRRDVYASAAAVDDELVDEHYQSSHQPGAQAAIAAYASGLLDHPVEAALARLDLPVWIAWGRRAANPRVELADQWLRRLPGAELEILEQCGILPHAESPDELCRKLERFLVERNLFKV